MTLHKPSICIIDLYLRVQKMQLPMCNGYTGITDRSTIDIRT